MPAQSRLLFALPVALLGASLAACGPSQQGSSTALAGDQNIQISGVIIEQSPESGGSPADIAAAKARVPHQYDERPPLNLFDFRTNLNPGLNR